ncbi:DUF6000 family protein [Streptomyces diastatochromogenes]|uniref:DUF6000 family protein n=1 Tax=Streptomyces diastatochromogenes TaxID=42236 RepID=UPI0036BC8CCF
MCAEARQSSPQVAPIRGVMWELSEDAGLITPHELAVLLEGGWRERRTAARLIAVSGRTVFRERLGDLLLASEVCCAGLASCVTLATFGTRDDADLPAACLDRYLRRPHLAYDQPVALGALLYIDLNLGADQAARCLAPGGLWRQWLQGTPSGSVSRHPATHLSLIRRLCAFADECAELRSSGRPQHSSAGLAPRESHWRYITHCDRWSAKPDSQVIVRFAGGVG